MFWFTIWMILNILVTILNKAFFSSFDCPYPTSVTLVHMVFSFLGSEIALRFKYTDTEKIPNEVRFRLNLMSFLFVANIVLGNAALSYCSIAFVQMVRCTTPAVTAVLAYFVLGSALTFRQAISLIPVVMGALLVSLGEVHLTWFGVFLTIAGVISSALKSILTKVFLSGLNSIHAMQLLRHVSLLGAFELVPLVFYIESNFFEKWIPQADPVLYVVLALHGTMAFFLNQSNFEANKETSPLFITVGGNVKQVACMVLSYFLFAKGKMTPLSIFGATITIIGGFLHAQEMRWKPSKDDQEKKKAKDEGGEEEEKESLLKDVKDESNVSILINELPISPSSSPIKYIKKRNDKVS